MRTADVLRDRFAGGEAPAAHGALAMTTPGGTSSATLEEVRRLMRGATPRVMR